MLERWLFPRPRTHLTIFQLYCNLFEICHSAWVHTRDGIMFRLGFIHVHVMLMKHSANIHNHNMNVG